MNKVYAHRHLGIFSSVFLTIDDDGFVFKGKKYTLNDIDVLRVVKRSGVPPRLGVVLKDGKHILVNGGALELNGQNAKSKFFSGQNDIFDDLVAYFESSGD